MKESSFFALVALIALAAMIGQIVWAFNNGYATSTEKLGKCYDRWDNEILNTQCKVESLPDLPTWFVVTQLIYFIIILIGFVTWITLSQFEH